MDADVVHKVDVRCGVVVLLQRDTLVTVEMNGPLNSDVAV